MATQERVYVGIGGHVVALDPNSGEIIWMAPLKGFQFVTVRADGDRIWAAISGEAFCLDAASGQRLWHNKLAGLGRGLVSLATARASSSPAAIQAQVNREAADLGAIG